MIASMRGDDSTIHRLLTLLRKEVEVFQLKQLRKNVFYLQTREGEFILKGFLSIQQLKLQERFSQSLREAGFVKTSVFINKKQPLYVAPYFFGRMKYLKEGFPSFHYRYESDRVAGLKMIHHFHLTTQRLVTEYEKHLSQFDIIGKWTDRLKQFVQNTSQLRYLIRKDLIDELIYWGDVALQGMNKRPHIFYSENKVIVHGDVAHHNFIRDEKRQVCLIDFDLISIGCPAIDFIQYTNRIMPSLQWSYERLTNYQQLKTYLDDQSFLYALLFPADIYREWNRFMRTKSLHHRQKVQQIIHLTTSQFALRQQFMNEVKSMIN